MYLYSFVCYIQGKIVGEGTYNELQADGTDFASLLKKRELEEEETREEIDVTIGSPG